MAQIILASASPRRSELLRQAGMDFVVIPSRGEEVVTSTHPAEVVEELSLQKAQEVADRILAGGEKKADDFSVVIGADTVVAADHKILGKPADHEDARKMITLLQGNVHQVYTGVTLIVKDEKGNIRTRTFNECTDVDVCEMSYEEVEEYISTPEPYDKAGAYGIQGSFGIYIRGIRGCYYNVVGLPISRLCHELKDMLALSAAVDLAPGVGQEEDVRQFLLNGGNAPGIMALKDAIDFLGHFHFFLLYNDSAFNDIDRGVGLDQGNSVKADGVGIAFYLQNVLAAHIIAACVLDDRNLIIFPVQMEIVVDQHGLAGFDMVENNSVFNLAYV